MVSVEYIKGVIGEERFEEIRRLIITGNYKTAYRNDRYVITDMDGNILLTFRSDRERQLFLEAI